MAAGSDRYVVLGGLALPIEPVLLLLELEERQLSIRRDGDDLVVAPTRMLTDEDCRRIRRWKVHLLALLDYEPAQVQ